MASQAIEAAPEDENPVFLVDPDTSEMTTAHRAVRRGVSSQREGTSIAPAHRLPGSNTFEGSRRSSGVAMAMERFTSASAASRSPVNEQRLLAPGKRIAPASRYQRRSPVA